jgi:hypothetical protein
VMFLFFVELVFFSDLVFILPAAGLIRLRF